MTPTGGKKIKQEVCLCEQSNIAPQGSAALPQGEGAKSVYTYEEVIELIKKDREAIIEFIEDELVMGVAYLFDKVPIKLQ